MSVSTDQLSLRERVTDFVVREADLADARDYEAWLELWAPEAIYWVPCNEDDYDPRQHVSIIYDDYQRLVERCTRLSSQGAFAQEPPSRFVPCDGRCRPRG